MKHTIKWVVHPNRRKKTGWVQGARQPVEPSDYFKYLCEVGAGFDKGKTKQRNV